ncbi:hypothetical protein TraAM80_01031 [Trypanosoma rangeli]|uniref:Right handed beta helix domain-containing protein n=1 Tax=Trypanosoma rangeli TaxID=5698 RepID=A0A3R7NT66_TRYRA|nr:uncharacterized protein TraAM80_01031 [Trypanosoma rangeli]RNF11243.1 hypothetical protein TraAM80_01031 [Trypanosoma rangeli]|eukprot:RNF11243.1 hypothetical protein TraAM80_01031 [Trypanosoma rangeli]
MELSAFMRETLKWPATDVTPDSFLTAAQQLPGGHPSTLSVSGYISCPHIENTDSCLIIAAPLLKDATASATAGFGGYRCVKKGRDIPKAIFFQPLKITSFAPLGFHGVWFMNRVDVVGRGPVFFSHCLFGTSACSSGVVEASVPSAFACVHLALNGACTFSGCSFEYRCGVGRVVGDHEVPAMKASGHTRVHISKSSFTGLGAESTALALSGSATLEADYMSVARCGGHGLIVGGSSRASVFRCVFKHNGAGLWVKEKGTLEIRDSSLKLVHNGRSILFLSQYGCCLAHGCLFLSRAPASSESTGRCTVVARDKSYISLNLCELFWSNAENPLERKESTDAPNFPLSFNARETMKKSGLCHVLLREQSAATMSRCIIGLPIAVKPTNRTRAVGVMLRNTPRQDSITLYAVENTVVYGWCMESDGVPRSTVPAGFNAAPAWGLVLPAFSGPNGNAERRQLKRMWASNNRFMESSEMPLRDVSRVCTSYDTYCSVSGMPLLTPDVEDDLSAEGSKSFSSLVSSTMTHCFGDFLFEEGVTTGPSPMQRTQSTVRTFLNRGNGILTPNSLFESTCPKRTLPKIGLKTLEEGKSDFTSLTSYSEGETENADFVVENKTPMRLSKIIESTDECTQKGEECFGLTGERSHLSEEVLHKGMSSSDISKWIVNKHCSCFKTIRPFVFSKEDATPIPLVLLPKCGNAPVSKTDPKKSWHRSCTLTRNWHHDGGKHQLQRSSNCLEHVARRRRRSSHASLRYPSIAPTQRDHAQRSTSTSVKAYEELLAYRSLMGTSPVLLDSRQGLSGARDCKKRKSALTKERLRQGPRVQQMLPTGKLGLCPGVAAQKRAFCNHGTDEEREIENDMVGQKRVKNVLDNAVGVRSSKGDTTGKATQVRLPSSHPGPDHSSCASHITQRGVRKGFLRVDDDVWSKLSKSRLSLGLVDRLRPDQRESKQLSHDEDNNQAQLPESPVTKARNGVSGARVAGPAHNYATQQGHGARSRTSRPTRTELEASCVASLIPRTPPRFRRCRPART